MAREKNETKTNNKNDRIYIRLNEQVKRDLEIVAKYKGLKTSALIHSLIVQTIHKLKDEKGELFGEERAALPTKAKKSGSPSLSEKLLARRGGIEKTFTTDDGRTVLLVDEGSYDR